MDIFHSDIKDLVARYLVDNLRSLPSSDHGSIIILPLKTVDDRWVSVIVEERQGGYFLVHDGGKTESELFCQGVTMSDVAESFNSKIATKYGVSIEDRMIQRLCAGSELPQTILAVAEASAAITVQLVSSLIEMEAREVEAKVSETLSLWSGDDFEIKHDLEIEGKYDSYILDFVALARNATRKTASIDILPRSSHLRRAKDYAFMLMDLRSTPRYSDWASLAVIAGAGDWSERALRIVKEMASETIEVSPATYGAVDVAIRKRLDALTSPSLPLRL